MVTGEHPLSAEFNLRRGNHYSLFYEAADDLAEAVVPFLAAGIANGEQCLWVTPSSLTRTAAAAALGRVVPDLGSRMDGGQVDILDHDGWYRATGAFHGPTIVEKWLDRERQALAAGYDGLRVTGDTLWLETPQDFRDFCDYEATLHRRLQGSRVACLCSYCLGRASARDMVAVMRNHDVALVRSGGNWDVVESAPLKTAKAELVERLARKERLLTEIHHRVKNNLQIISSLLTLKSADFGGPFAQMALEETLNRIAAMGLIHEMLYEQDDGGFIHFPGYLRRLLSQLSLAYRCRDRVLLSVEEIGDTIPLVPFDTAVPLAMAVAEAFSNAIKHGFPDGRAGTVRAIVEGSPRALVVTIQDDGRGCHQGWEHKNRGGLALIEGLASQTGGQAEIVCCSNGVSVRISAPVG